MITQALSNKIKNASLVFALLIVALHFYLRFERGSVMWFLNQVICDVFARTGVPFFFIVSGFFLSRHIGERGWYRHETVKRIRTILVPLFLLSFSAFLCYTSLSILGNLIHGRFAYAGIDISFATVVSALGINPYAFPAISALWYLRSLFLFVLISPLLYRSKGGVIAILFVMYWLVCPSRDICDIYPILFPLRAFFSLEGLFYFTVGLKIISLRNTTNVSRGGGNRGSGCSMCDFVLVSFVARMPICALD